MLTTYRLSIRRMPRVLGRCSRCLPSNHAFVHTLTVASSSSSSKHALSTRLCGVTGHGAHSIAVSHWHCRSQTVTSSNVSHTAGVRAYSSKGGKYSSDLVRSVRAMPIKLISVGKGNSKAATAMAEEWITKLERYTSVNEVLIKPNPKGSSSPQVQKDAEAEKVLKSIASGDKVIILDERGREATSEDVARLIADAGDNGTPLTFVVGGPFGHGAAVVERANDSIRLSRMVMNHQVAYVVLIEQLYRAWTIIKGEPYHH